ncbi:pyridoxamine 5'-phosphate oxidase family protein [Pseudonocardia acaciae]|uniref:pyridoxamine 5'-phosphate oxidase family protein n=1 Tax=Pseudonocardia acaciae TaxID=551276 RepID=UPI00048BAB73|nr:pyridoxamine 5'-phosphate oxidase family protein [Pseudonocardia acaciae]
MTAVLTDDDRAFLAETRLGFITVAAPGDGAWPTTRPVWFESTPEGTVQLFSGVTSPKVRRLRDSPRASILVANNAGEPERWISIVGTVTIEPDGAGELASRLGARYWDLSDPEKAATLREMVDSDIVRIVIHPETVARYAA